MRWIIPVICACLLISCGGNPPEIKESHLTVSPSVSKYQVPVALDYLNTIGGQIYSSALAVPSGLGIDAQGNIYVSDADNHRIIKFDREFKPVNQYGGYGSGVGRLSNPQGIVIDRGLNIYVLDEGNGRVVHLDANLNYVEEIIPVNDSNEIISTFSRYTGLSISSMGEVTVADYDNSRLIRMDNFFEFSRYIGDFGYGRGALLNPMNIITDKKGNLLVADAGNGRISMYDEFGNYKKSFGEEQLNRPTALTSFSDGTIWVADEEKDSLYIFDPSFRFLASLGYPDVLETGFDGITGLGQLRDDRVIIADSGNDRLLVYHIIYEAVEQ